ncbi:phage holin family protein [Piscirickettsia litoralis]|uniref:phage holin family protein n=1 Tax=Piscirickettsia litoralis TaxID=1891921 RepID=UPI001112F2CF
MDFIVYSHCSEFADVITHYFCVAINLNNAMTVGLIGLSGYMGANSMQLILNIIKGYFAYK